MFDSAKVNYSRLLKRKEEQRKQRKRKKERERKEALRERGGAVPRARLGGKVAHGVITTQGSHEDNEDKGAVISLPVPLADGSGSYRWYGICLRTNTACADENVHVCGMYRSTCEDESEQEASCQVPALSLHTCHESRHMTTVAEQTGGLGDRSVAFLLAGPLNS